MSVLMATIMFVMVPRASASAERIQQVLDTEPSVTDPEPPVTDAPAAAAASSSGTWSSATPAPRIRC